MYFRPTIIILLATTIQCTKPSQEEVVQTKHEPSQNNEIENLNSKEVVKTFYFDFNKSVLNTVQKKELRKSLNNIGTENDSTIEIHGHCDKIGSTEYNVSLGMKRAISVAKELQRAGLSKEKILPISHGEEKPLIKTNSPDEMRQNRRVEIVTTKL